MRVVTSRFTRVTSVRAVSWRVFLACLVAYGAALYAVSAYAGEFVNGAVFGVAMTYLWLTGETRNRGVVVGLIVFLLLMWAVRSL